MVTFSSHSFLLDLNFYNRFLVTKRSAKFGSTWQVPTTFVTSFVVRVPNFCLSKPRKYVPCQPVVMYTDLNWLNTFQMRHFSQFDNSCCLASWYSMKMFLLCVIGSTVISRTWTLLLVAVIVFYLLRWGTKQYSNVWSQLVDF